jgi:8-oxo-dGTP diphosphatase
MNVVAAVMERDGRVLICQRKAGRRHALKWEFPGGKVEEGEDLQEALARELREELRVEANVGEELGRYDIRFASGAAIQLIFFHVTEFSGEPVNTEFERIVWEERRKLVEYDFLEGDVEFVRKLAGV